MNLKEFIINKSMKFSILTINMHTAKIVMMEKNLLPLKLLLTQKSQLFFKTKMKSSNTLEKFE